MSATAGSRTGRPRVRVLTADDQSGPGGHQTRVPRGPRHETPKPSAPVRTARSTSSDNGGGLAEAGVPVPRRETDRGRAPRSHTAPGSGQANRPVKDGR
ncbi:hypothetical protein [Streptomyces sp. NPDC021562]|uniref:hypothetical protein n=1 Tax=Streptomyces sp. NPDC021562 TaxID=3155121 RepID=UPI0010494885